MDGHTTYISWNLQGIKCKYKSLQLSFSDKLYHAVADKKLQFSCSFRRHEYNMGRASARRQVSTPSEADGMIIRE
jgi:hypothetical protein